jgi:hypothetical protein
VTVCVEGPATPTYRGYSIELVHDRLGWRVAIHPTQPDLPILGQYSFRPDPLREGTALEEAKYRIDRVLANERTA